MKVPEKIQRAFVKFIFRGGYKVKPTPQGVDLTLYPPQKMNWMNASCMFSGTFMLQAPF